MHKIFTGRILSTKMNNTVVVRVERKFRHPLYQKVLRRHKKYLVDSNRIELNENDLVSFKETRPISKNKHFIVIKKLKD